MYIIKEHQMPKPLSEVMGKEFDVTEMGPGLQRGMVLKVYKAKIKQLIGRQAIASLLGDLKDARLTKDNYENPMLIIRFKPGSMWRNELHMRRYQLKMLINKRLKCEFIRDVRVR